MTLTFSDLTVGKERAKYLYKLRMESILDLLKCGICTKGLFAWSYNEFLKANSLPLLDCPEVCPLPRSILLGIECGGCNCEEVRPKSVREVRDKHDKA